METQALTAEVREERGKGPARRLRAAGKLPAVLYGPGMESVALTVSPKEITTILQSERGRNTVLRLQYGGKEKLAMVRDLAQDPVSYELLHIDFYKVDLDREVHCPIPFSTTGRAIGVQKGGLLNVTARTVPVRSTPDKIPASIVHDISGLDIHQTVTVADLDLPEGVTPTLKSKQTLVVILEDRRAVAKGETEDE